MRLKTFFVLVIPMLMHVFPAISNQPRLPRNRSNRAPFGLMMPGASSARTRPRPSIADGEPRLPQRGLSQEVSVEAAGRGKPWINLGDGHELLTTFSGDPKLVASMEKSEIQPVQMAAGDLDGDGVPDLADGFSGPEGNIVAVYRGNIDAIYPNSQEAIARKKSGSFTSAPFLSPARLFQAPSRPDFLETGDFNGDGFVDVALATRGGNTLYVLLGDGAGGLGTVKSVPLPGNVTALASGDVNRRDGLLDLLVGISGQQGAKLLVFEGPNGALNSQPETIALPADAAAVSTGYLYGNTYTDIAVAAGRYLVTVHGRDRQLSRGPGATDPPAMLSTYALPAAGQSISIGKFSARQTADAAVFMDDGRIELFGGRAAVVDKLRVLESGKLGHAKAGPAARLIKAKVSGAMGDDLIVMDPAASRLRVLTGARGSANPIFSDGASPIDLASDAAPIAVLLMRLNTSARNDLVVLRAGHVNASIVPAQFDNIFTVTTTTDDDPNIPMVAGVRPSQDGSLTLRDSIDEAVNAPQGSSNEIVFNIDQTGVPVISLEGPLPNLPFTSSVTIDGTTQAQVDGSASLVELQGNGNDVLVMPGASNVIRGLAINTAAVPIQLTTGTGDIVEGNFIGTASDGITPRPNSDSGVIVSGGSGNVIGGTAAPASNVIGANQLNGITIANGATGTMVMRNFVGVDDSLQVNLANGQNGIQIGAGATATTVGATNAANFFDLNGLDGIAISSGTNHLVVNTASQANLGNGMSISGATATTVGGAQGSSLGDGFWSNSQNGLVIESGATGITVQGNGIGIAFSSGTPQQFPNAMDGISISASANLIGGAGGSEAGLGNSIAFNGVDGVAVMSGDQNAILSNVIAANSPGEPIHLFPGTNNNATPPDVSAATVVGSPSASTAAGSAGSVKPAETFSPVMVISFAFKGAPNQTFNLQFFVPEICNCTNCFASVQIFSTQVVTDSDGNAPSPVELTLVDLPPANSFINATATDAANNTSQFSECVQVGTTDACAYTLSTSSEQFSSEGGSGSFSVTTSSSCPITPISEDTFIHVSSQPGAGSETVNFTVDPNTGSGGLQGTIFVATGVSVTINQAAPGPNFSLLLGSNTVAGSPGSVTPVTVTISRNDGYTGVVIVTPPGKANGIKIKPATAKKLKGSNTSFTVNVKITATAVAGTYPFTFTATGAGLTGSQSATLSVAVQ